MAAIKDLGDTIKAQAVAASVQPAPVQDSADNIIASIINPPIKKEM